ncbi:type VI secretion system baseplate subunit TssF [Sulfurimonas sp. MAG313]|nr:type VI secretion system baseplate subunit TssF [Sulfurimonas sp. MAG313]MDF1880605.1 type VI secretion system baseplate subunit TssF [Sulfurimonas sp. MAG313]
MKINDYYLQELHALRQTGAEFARENPGLSPYLAKEGQDPDVERLLEGFAFLTGRLRQQMDEELPELSHNLVQLLWPNYVRPIPSMSIIEYKPLTDAYKAQTVSRGTQVLSHQSTSTQCRFKTVYETVVEAYEIKDVLYTVQGDKSTLSFDFSLSAGACVADLSLESMRLHLLGSKLMAKENYLFFSRYTDHLEFELLDSEHKVLETIQLSSKKIKPLGFDRDQTVLPYPRNVFDGYALLQEYFCYEEKYYFINFEKLNLKNEFSEETLSSAASFRMNVKFNKRLPEAYKPTSDHFKLYCTPIVNLFSTDATPIRKSSLEEEYMVVASEFKKDESEVFSIDKVRGWVPSKSAYEDYEAFETFKEEGSSFYYSTRVKLSIDAKRTQTFLRFAGSEGLYEELHHSNATVSVEFSSTNKDLPSRLAMGVINTSDPLSEVAHLEFESITIPTFSYPPPIEGDFLWKIISNMSLNYLSLSDLKTLKTILKTYDFLGSYDQKQKEHTEHMLRGLHDVSYEHTSIIYQGLPIKGVITTLEVIMTKFASKGEMYLFCNVLNEFFALYGNINTFHQLRVETDEGETFEWAAKMGYDVLK